MTDQASTAETTLTSLSMEDVFSDKPIEEVSTPVSEDKTKADDTAPPAEAPKEPEAKTDPELDKLKKRLEDTQKWGQSQRQATLQIIKNLRDKGLSDDDIADTIGGREIFDKVQKGTPVEQELNNPVAAITQVFDQQIAAVEAAMIEMGTSPEDLKEYMAAFNTLAFEKTEHRDEMYRRATSGEGNVAAYAIKIGKEKVEEYRLSQELQTLGPKAYEDKLREKIKAELAATATAVKDEVNAELGGPQGKPRLAGNGSAAPSTESKGYESLTDIFGR